MLTPRYDKCTVTSDDFHHISDAVQTAFCVFAGLGKIAHLYTALFHFLHQPQANSVSLFVLYVYMCIHGS